MPRRETVADGPVHAVAEPATETACGEPAQRMYRLRQAWVPERGGRDMCQACREATMAGDPQTT